MTGVLTKTKPKMSLYRRNSQLVVLLGSSKHTKSPATVGSLKYWSCPLVAFVLQALHFLQGKGE